MKLSTTDLRTERQWRSATGLDQNRFAKLLFLFEQGYQDLFNQSIEERQFECSGEPHLSTYEDLLLFTLLSLKSGLTYDLLGIVTGMDGSNAKRNHDLGISILQRTLYLSGYKPKREFGSVEEFRKYFENHKVIIIDGTEQRTKRPSDNDYQQEMYSGKKNPIQ